MMSRDAFHAKLREFLHRSPFRPFVVELTDGKAIHVEEPTVAFGLDLGGYLTPAYDLVEFRRDQVIAIRLASEEIPA